MGSTIGAGIFVLTGGASKYAGPSVIISYFLAGLISMPTAIVYSELSGRIPLRGSGYSYVYRSFGEVAAHLMAWSILLRYVGAAASVSRSWGDYFVLLLSYFGITVPNYLHKY